MGCSDSRSLGPVETPKIEKTIQEAERSLSFWRNKLKYQIISIENIDFPLDVDHLDLLSYALQYPKDGSTATFLKRLAIKNLLSIKLLKFMTILLSISSRSSKLYLLRSDSKEENLKNIELLFDIAVVILPLNLKILDVTVVNFSELLELAKENFLEKLRSLPLEFIKNALEEVDLTSKGIRYFCYSEYLHNKEQIKLKMKFLKSRRSAVVETQSIFSVPCKTEESEEVSSELESTPRDSLLSERLSPVIFDHSIAQFSRRFSDASILFNSSLTKSDLSEGDLQTEKDTEPIDFLEKLKGIKSLREKVVENPPVAAEPVSPPVISPRQSVRMPMSGLSPKLVEKILRRKSLKSKAN